MALASLKNTPSQPTLPDDIFDLHKIEAELNRLSAVNADLLGTLSQPTDTSHNSHDEPPLADTAIGMIIPAESNLSELDHLRRENEELQELAKDLDERLSKSQLDAEKWIQQQNEYETILEQKSELIRDLYLQVQEKQTLASEPRQETNGEDLERLRLELEEKRRVLKEDEESMMSQLREMEMALSKDRADLARQRQELTRIQSELAREVEISGRDVTLSDRIKTLRRLTEGQKPAISDTSTPPPKEIKGTSVFRRLFG